MSIAVTSVGTVVWKPPRFAAGAMWSGRYTHERPKDDHALKFRPVAGLNWEFRPKKTLNPLFFYYTTVVHSFLSLLCDLSLPAGCRSIWFSVLCSHFNHSSVVFVSFFTSLFHLFSSSFFMFLSFGVILFFLYNLFYFLPLSVSMFVGMLCLFSFF
jgi:hypothetical protein